MTSAPLVGLLVALGSALAPAPEAVDKRVCVDAYESAHELRQRNLLQEVRERLTVCSDPRCPRVVSDECRALSVEIDRMGAPAPAAALSPSPAAQVTPAPDAAMTALPAAATPAAPSHTAVGAAPRPAPFHTQRPARASYAALLPGGLAVVALASTVFFGWRGLSQAEELRRTCSPECEPSQVLPVRRQLLIADLSLLAGVGLGTVTAWMLWTGRSERARAAAAAGAEPAGQVAAGGWSLVPGFSSLNVEYGGRF